MHYKICTVLFNRLLHNKIFIEKILKIADIANYK